ncbi:MAG: glycosyltransferase family 4 protein [Deltaproteobacteria bacterium]|nr:glycosyltransferase family 4 protein [Deltaproteobacteria bacterium]
MLKVAVVIPKYGLVGGAEGFVYALTERLARRDEFEIHVFANRYRRGKAPIVFHRVPILVFPRFLKQISFAWFVNRRIQKGGYHLVHSHDRIFRMNLFTMHGIPHETWIRRMRNKHLSLFDRGMTWVEKKGLTGPPVPMVLPVSTLVKNELQRSYPVSESHIKVIHPGVSLDRFNEMDNQGCRQEIRTRHGINKEDLVILFVGMNFEIKRLRLLIEGISRLSSGDGDGPAIKLLVVGKGKKMAYMNMAREYGVADRITFAGVTREIEKYYFASDIFAMPSVYDTFGMAVLEAMAAGLPVIISRTVGARDLVNDGVEGFVLGDPPTADELSEKIKFLSNAENRLKMGERARQQALKHDWERVADQMAALYLTNLPAPPFDTGQDY